jgi:hypothetical protein
MPAVMILDQRSSRRGRDRVKEWLTTVNADYAEALRLPFVRTAGDEMQGVVDDPEAIVAIALGAVADGGWWTGIGFGGVEIAPGANARDSRGEAFWNAREAVEAAKHQRPRRPVVVRGPTQAAEDLNSCLAALSFIVRRRTRRQQAVAGLYGVATQVAIAQDLGVSQQAVSGLVDAAGVTEELELRRLAVRLAEAALA